MSGEAVSTPVAAAVFVGSAVLVGAPVTYAVLTVGFNAAFLTLDVLNVSVTFEPGPLTTLFVLVAVALVAWLWMRLSYEVAHLRLYGVSALSRGSRVGVLARYLVAWATVLGLLGFAGAFGLLAGLALVDAPSPAAFAGLLLVVAVLWVFARAGLAFRDGLQTGAQ